MSPANQYLSPDKVKVELINRVINGAITTFSEAKAWLATVDTDKNALRPVLADVFRLIQKLYWGVFSSMNKESHLKLWHELVIPDEETREFGDLKQYMMLSKIFVGILDIHGYTQFCEEKKNNITMLQRLDEFISTKIYQCAQAVGVIAAREMGDSVILIGSDACSLLSATFEIIQLFGKERQVHFQSDIKADYYLPAFQVSAGIAGGQASNPLVITEKGGLAGSLINSAARLQSRANSISSNSTKVIVEQYVLVNFEKTPNRTGFLEKLNFFYNGEIAFKGVSMKNYEVYLYNPAEHYKSQIQDYLTKLQNSINENQWQSNVFLNLCDLGSVTAKFHEPFYYSVEVDRKPVHVTNQYVDAEFRDIKNLIGLSDFVTALDKLGFLCKVLDQCDAFDKLVLEHCVTIYNTYQIPLRKYQDLMNDYIQKNIGQVFTPDEMKVNQLYVQVEKSYQHVQKTLRQGEHMKDKRMKFWYNAIETTKQDIDFKIFSGKK